MDKLPCLRRDIGIFPLQHEGRNLIAVRDDLGIADAGLALNADIGRYLVFFDGTSSLRDLQLAISRQQGGVIVPAEEIRTLVEQLDRLGLLQTDRYRRAKEQVVVEFSRRPERAAHLAGSAYPSDPEELAAEIDRLLRVPDSTDLSDRGEAPCAVAAPHIDLKVSGASYGLAYRDLHSLSPPALLLLGTGHSLEHLYSLSDKTFVTPMGSVPADRETVDRLRGRGGDLLAPDDFAHRNEHSIEFQLLFLQRLFPMEKIPIVPLLCGPLEHLVGAERKPLEVPALEQFVNEIRAWLGEPPAGKLVVAGVDLSHVGPKFGDPQPARAVERDFRASDRQLLSSLEAGGADAFFDDVAKTGNPFKVCGFSALWTLLAVLPGVQGKVLDYRVWHEEATHSAVSFAAVSFSFPDRGRHRHCRPEGEP